ncbi:unnamed protein product [Ectocarpus fasciculatus]
MLMLGRLRSRIKQACDGQGKRWYTSTLELQLVSLAFCVACRDVPTLHVRVDRQTPATLWSPRKSHTTSNKRSREVCTSSRVPAVQAFGLTWALPLEVLQQRAAMEPRSGSECQQRLTGPPSASRLRWEIWSQNLKRLEFDSDMPLNTVSWPASIQQLSFRVCFNHQLWESRGRSAYRRYRSGMSSTSPLPKSCGRPLCSSYRSGRNLNTPWPGSYGRPPYQM